MSSECPNCERRFAGSACPGCGWSAATGGETKRKRRMICDCGARLMASGLCSAMGGYPATEACPIACPLCGGLLGWDGGCERCHGCTSGLRKDWTFPGDRYDLDKGHWQRTEGPRKACSPEENAAGFAKLRAALGFDLARPSSQRVGLVPAVDPAIRAELERRATAAKR